jgi:DNA-directed RNA polymerase specialized sigma24 family protein
LTDTNTSSAAAQALQLLITAAQVGDNGALLKLCSDFKPLLSSEARREMFYNSLGKDAEGIAVLAFIELVLKYSGTDYVNWPGYARCRVHFALFDAMQKQGRIWENEIAINTDSEEGTALLDEAGLQQGLPDDIAQLLLSLEVRQALEQQQVIELLFLREQKPKEAARLLGCSVRNVTKHRLKGLDKLRLLLKQNG